MWLAGASDQAGEVAAPHQYSPSLSFLPCVISRVWIFLDVVCLACQHVRVCEYLFVCVWSDAPPEDLPSCLVLRDKMKRYNHMSISHTTHLNCWWLVLIIADDSTSWVAATLIVTTKCLCVAVYLCGLSFSEDFIKLWCSVHFCLTCFYIPIESAQKSIVRHWSE